MAFAFPMPEARDHLEELVARAQRDHERVVLTERNGPKMLQRVLRFRRFVSLADAAGGPANLAQAAVDSGYADQPHLTRETARLAGLSPAALVRERRPGG
jgi:AraC-like DNA-binding protein